MIARKKLGEILVEGGLLTQKQLDQALPFQKKSTLKLGQFLVREGIVSETQIVELLSNQLKLEKYRPDKHILDMELSHLVPAEIAHRYGVAPLQKSGTLLTVAMMDPLDINALDAVEVYTNHEVEAVICAEQQLNQLHTTLYGTYAGIGGVLDDMEDMEIDKGTEKTATLEDVEVSSLQGMAQEAPVVRLVNSILSQSVREGASDIHISPEKDHVQIRFRVDGKLHEVPAPPKSMFLPIISRLKILANMDIALSRVPQDGRFTVKMKNKDINIRASTIPSIHGENLVLRLLDTSTSIYSLELLGMNEGDRKKIEGIITKPYGMILSTGPTGSGKSTSLYSILKRINQPDINIITVEDPVEYRIDKIRQVQLNRKAGMTFASGLRSILRQDPDVIMVGEIRDSETAGIAVQAALTGHRVLSTLHTNDAAGAMTRMMDMGIEPFLVSSVMLVSFAQRLVRRICPQCRQPYTPSPEAAKYWTLQDVDVSGMSVGQGCFNCMHTGFKGRTGIFEVLVIDDLVRDMIIRHCSSHEINRAAIQAGNFVTLRDNALEKAVQGVTSLEEAASAVLM
ncbi:MAG: Flp pilus assembly complex ATPase component TadA [Deltaproteobacteria bacterium]|nr:Flp pilus assembly complex ATPase component TadA [Deltaproteobacteria bacterium]